MLTVNLAGGGQAEDIAGLGRTTFVETFGHLFRAHPDDLTAYLDRTFAPSKIAAGIAKRTNRFWLACSDAKPVGYAKLKLDSAHPAIAGKHVAQLQKIYVLRDHLGLRAGQALLSAVEVYALAAGVSRLWLTVLNTNSRAIGFYEHNGWRACGTDHHAIGAQTFPYLVLEKALSPARP